MRISDVIPDISLEAPSAPDPLITKYFIESARDFCRRTRYWREDLDPIDFAVDVNEYDLFTPVSGTEIIDVVTAALAANSQPLIRGTPRNISYSATVSGDPTSFALPSKNLMRLGPTPSAALTGALNVRVSLQPTQKAVSISDRLMSDYGDKINYGTLSRLLRMPKKPWSNASMAGFYLAEYENSIPVATAMAEDEYTKGVVRTVRYGGY